jgi:hypothetical protein
LIGLLKQNQILLRFDLKKIFIDIPRDELLKKISKELNLCLKKNVLMKLKNLIQLKLK